MNREIKGQISKFKIIDWAGNEITLPDQPTEFVSWDDAEEALSLFLGDEYEKSRGEYFITGEKE